MNSRPFLSVVIPCYNEERNLANGVLEEVQQYLAAQKYVWQVIVVNDKSTDRSRDLVQNFVQTHPQFSLLDISHGGKPTAVWTGIQQATGDVVLLTDMDQSTPIRELSKLLPWYEQGFDTVIGSRGAARGGFSLVRKLGSFVFRNLRGLLILRDITDTQCGFKLFRREVLLAVSPFLEFSRRKGRSAGWQVTAYDVELLYLIGKAGYRIKEVTVDWYNRDQSDTKSQAKGDWARYVRESMEMAREILRVKINQRQGLYDELGRAVSDRTVSDWGLAIGTANPRPFLSIVNPAALIRNDHRGKRYAVRTGMLAARGHSVMFSGADLSAPIEEVAHLLPWFERGYGIVIDSREGKGAKRIKEPFYRHVMGSVFNSVGRALTVHGIDDTQCGFKTFRDDVARDVFSRMELYGANAKKITDAMVTGFDVEVLFIGQKSGVKIKEVPVEWRYGIETRVSPLRHSWRNFRDVVLVRGNDVREMYDRK